MLKFKCLYSYYKITSIFKAIFSQSKNQPLMISISVLQIPVHSIHFDTLSRRNSGFWLGPLDRAKTVDQLIMMLLATLCLLIPVALCPGLWSLVLVTGSLVHSPWSMQGLALMFRQDDELYLTSMCLGGGPPPPAPSLLTCVYPATFDATQTTNTYVCMRTKKPPSYPCTHPPTLASDESRTWICLFYCQNIKVNSRRCRRTGLIVIRGRCRQRCTYARVENRWKDHAGYFVLLATFGLTP